MTVIQFTVLGEPASKARARFTGRGSKVRAFTPERTREAESRIAAAYLAVAHRGNKDDFRTAYAVRAEFHLAKRQRRDVDNMLKLVLDGLNQVAWADDNQAIELTGRKFFDADEARTVVAITAVGEMPRNEATCEHCGKNFARSPSHSGKKYCSGECRSAALAARRLRACLHCGLKFKSRQTSNTAAGEQRYCSTGCAYAAKHVDVTCAACGNQFTRARNLNRSGNAYCSDECKATYWRERRKSAVKGTCQDCGGPTTKKTYQRCRDCSYAAGGRWADRNVITEYEEPA